MNAALVIELYRELFRNEDTPKREKEVADNKLKEMLANDKISLEEYKYITEV